MLIFSSLAIIANYMVYDIPAILGRSYLIKL